MAITLSTLSAYPLGFSANGYSADFSGTEELVAAPAAGSSIYLESLTISSAAALTLTVGCGETGPGSVETVLIGPIGIGAGQTIVWRFVRPIMCVAAKSLTLDASGAGAVVCHVEGYVDEDRN